MEEEEFVPTSQPLEEVLVPKGENKENFWKGIRARLVRCAPPVKFRPSVADVKTPAARIHSWQLVRRVSSPGPVNRFRYKRAASRIFKEILAVEALAARMRKRRARFLRKARARRLSFEVACEKPLEDRHPFRNTILPEFFSGIRNMHPHIRYIF
ncbi:hypothetical protein DFH07DRAFT_764298 [Mycena maculata]|uniref:Uncharacterized protein n=1 Tax=Mycena maculata TaxID=230809 RepID=A0AAD7KEG3_9AGAR|nr:hypothetical protein DFH07DRAFT_764298 [Mycena maculata]